MKIPKYWARENMSVVDSDGYAYFLSKNVSSEESVSAARVKAKAALQVLKAKIDAGHELSRDYEYGSDGEICEELIEEIHDADELIGAITRNRYGALVLNTKHVMFVDVDFPKTKIGFIPLVLELFGFGDAREKKSAEIRDETLARIETFIDATPSIGARVYRTFAGYRLLVTSGPYDPLGAASRKIMDDLDADLLFRRLCERQACYRARISAKPWRAGLKRPLSIFPRSEADDTRFRTWLTQYERRDREFCVCWKVGDYGVRGVHSDVARILSLHDHYALGRDTEPLA